MIPYQIGNVFVSHTQDETQEMLETEKVGSIYLVCFGGICSVSGLTVEMETFFGSIPEAAFNILCP